MDPGLIAVLRTEIIPRLLADAPDRPTAAELAADPLRHRFTVVFDRAGFSPEFFAEQKTRRVAVLTYHKFPGADWAVEEFTPHELVLTNGEQVTLALAERGTCLSNGLWVREIRQREENSHQVSLLSTDYRSELRPLAVRLFARWTQENFFKYMREHYAIDRLVEQGTEPLPETTTVVNPARCRLENELHRERTLFHRDQAAFGAPRGNTFPTHSSSLPTGRKRRWWAPCARRWRGPTTAGRWCGNCCAPPPICSPI